MKLIIASLLGLFTIVGPTIFGPPAASLDSASDSPTYIHCEAESLLGGTCSVVCPENIGCSCNTGLVTCMCQCYFLPDASNEPLDHMIDPGPKDNWDKVSGALLKEPNAAAQQVGRALQDLYKLYAKDKSAYNERAKSVESQFNALPSSIQSRALNTIR